MSQRLILEGETTTYEVLIESPIAGQPSEPMRTIDGYESYGADPKQGMMVPEEMRVKLADVHRTIRGYTEYAIGAFKNLAIAEVEELTLKFNLKISAEAGLPMLANGKMESDFAIEVKCKFPKQGE